MEVIMLCFTEGNSGVIMLHGSDEAAGGPFTMILGLVSPVTSGPGLSKWTLTLNPWFFPR